MNFVEHFYTTWPELPVFFFDMKKRAIQIFKILLIIYCLGGIALYHFQERILFHPEPVAADFKYDFKGRTKEVFIPVNAEEKIHLVKFFADSPSRGVVIYFHGNMKNVSWYAGSVLAFTDRGFDVWMHDYPGFGKTTGKLTEERLYRQSIQVRKLAGENYAKDSIVLYGRSIGSGIAAYVAANSENKLLIMEAPYSSIPSLFSRYAFIYPVSRMSSFKIPTKKFIREVKEPILIFHGKEDRTIPLQEAHKLKGGLKPGDMIIEIEQAGHNNIPASGEYQKALSEWLQK